MTPHQPDPAYYLDVPVLEGIGGVSRTPKLADHAKTTKRVFSVITGFELKILGLRDFEQIIILFYAFV